MYTSGKILTERSRNDRRRVENGDEKYRKAYRTNLNEERIEKDIPTFKVQLAALERLSKFELPVEAEPPMMFRLKKEG